MYMEIYKFSAEWCGPCKAYKEIFNRVTSNYSDIDVNEIDIDKNISLAQEFGIRSIPTTVIRKNGVELKKIVGIVSEHELTKHINKYINI